MGDGWVVLRLDVDCGGHEPLTGAVCAADGPEREFSGWSELFAALQVALAESR